MIPAAQIRPIAHDQNITIRSLRTARVHAEVEPRLHRELSSLIYGNDSHAGGHIAGLQMARNWPVNYFTKGQ